MDEDLLLTGGVEANVDDLGDALMEFMNAPAATDAAPAAEEQAATTNDGAGEIPTVPDGRLVTELNKKQAKAELDKKAYKAWKKAMKALGMGGDSDDEGAEKEKSEKKEKKDKSDKKEKKDKSKKDKKSSKRDRDGEDDFAAEVEGLAGDDEALENAKRRRRDKVKSRMAKLDTEGGANEDDYDGYAGVGLTSSSGASRRGAGNASSAANATKRLSKEERDRINYANAFALVNKMAEARKHDTEILKKRAAMPANAQQGAAPIARLLIKDEVLNFARKADNEVPLVRSGFLREIAFWILDGATNTLAPLDLRNIAFEVLLRYGFKGSMDATHPNRVVDHEDLNAWTGIGREELEGTTLGKAVNTARQHTSETAQNRQRAVTLLQRLSKAFSNAGDDDEVASDDGRKGKKGSGANGGPLAVRWPCERDSSIATPFEYITNATEVFQSKVVQVDPLDPESYLRVPPLRIRKTPIR